MKIELPDGKIIEADPKKTIRDNLKSYKSQLYHKDFRLFNCRGFGTCGTCAIKIEGAVTAATRTEKIRLNFPPHKQSLEKGLRLACQCYPLEDIKITKADGRWGQKI